MQRVRLFIWILFACSPVLLAGCNTLEPDREERLTLYVAPQTVECTGVYV